MIRRRALPLIAAAALTVPALSGCVMISTENPEPAPAATTAPGKGSGLPNALPSGVPSLPSGRPGLPGGAKPADGGTIGDPCDLLTRIEVIALTGRQVSQIDSDGEDETAAVRFCQWQLADGQLAIFISHTTKADFELQAKAGTPITGVGDDAYTQSGHLFVLAGDTQIDVYARGGEDAANLKVAKQVATKLLPKLR
ncbi:hypothetical protein J2S43_005176 [Catenuloplanes nepalensis]|uniref:DUF3558 domain-containing protein n=1 Tax=Catenuloplanes nepalensis TaxID=587533 RepID=A0ABT9MYZ5_9ACTN|nr:DUF3558 family protein [Catenuloplanes nepalensis]MDP9796664.1 hypothetical protein [Catenuloplanes nepalensis]